MLMDQRHIGVVLPQQLECFGSRDFDELQTHARKALAQRREDLRQQTGRRRLERRNPQFGLLQSSELPSVVFSLGQSQDHFPPSTRQFLTGVVLPQQLECFGSRDFDELQTHARKALAQRREDLRQQTGRRRLERRNPQFGLLQSSELPSVVFSLGQSQDHFPPSTRQFLTGRS